MVTLRKMRMADVKESCEMRHHAFLGTPLSDWLMGTTAAGTILSMSEHVFSLVILGETNEYVAVDDTGKILGSISYSVQGEEQTQSILARLEAYLFSWEFYLLNLAGHWRERGSVKERMRKREIIIEALHEGQKQNLHDKGISRYVYLSVLAVGPSAQGSGTGGKLLQLSLDLAQELGVPCYLESTDAGYRFYLKKGFKDTGVDIYVDDDDKRIWTPRLLIWHPH